MLGQVLRSSAGGLGTVNYHLLYPCNMGCKFCFATFLDSRRQGPPLRRADALELVDCLCHAGATKINFVGGEPTLVDWLPDLIRAAKLHGVTTSIVTNGSRLTEGWLDDIAPWLDIIALSIDSVDPETQRRIGRVEEGKEPISAERYCTLAALIKSRGIRLKVNTVVNAFNADEELWPFVRDLGPERWKIFQALRVEGQNDAAFETVRVTLEQFESYVERNRLVGQCGVTVVPENNELMTASYRMVDPWGRFFDDSQGRHTYSRPILEVGVGAALDEVTFDRDKFVERGGDYV